MELNRERDGRRPTQVCVCVCVCVYKGRFVERSGGRGHAGGCRSSAHLGSARPDHAALGPRGRSAREAAGRGRWAASWAAATAGRAPRTLLFLPDAPQPSAVAGTAAQPGLEQP